MDKRQELLWLGVISLPIAYLLARLFGLFYFHEQPFAVYGFEPLWPHAIDNSFPSDHVALGGALATAVFFVHRRLGLLLWLLVLSVGLLRVAAGLHYPIDIVGGTVAGVLAGTLTFLSYTVAYRRR